MVPKWFQNFSKIDPGGALEASWETPLKQGASKTSFLTILAPFWDPPLGPLWAHFGYHFLMFLKCLFEGFGLHLGSQNTSNMRPKRIPKPRPGNHRFCFYLLHFGHIQRCCKSSCFAAFWELCFGKALGSHFGDFSMHSSAVYHKQKRSKSRGISKRMQQRASKKLLLSSYRLALKSSLAYVNELSGPR